jgi:hypothetical protein
MGDFSGIVEVLMNRYGVTDEELAKMTPGEQSEARRLRLTRDQIEVSKVAQNLNGYQNDQREQTAHVIVRRKNVYKLAGLPSRRDSNDFGAFQEEDGTWSLHASDYDKAIGVNTTPGAPWFKTFMSEWSATRIEARARAEGWTYERETKASGEIHVRVRCGYAPAPVASGWKPARWGS